MNLLCKSFWLQSRWKIWKSLSIWRIRVNPIYIVPLFPGLPKTVRPVEVRDWDRIPRRYSFDSCHRPAPQNLPNSSVYLLKAALLHPRPLWNRSPESIKNMVVEFQVHMSQEVDRSTEVRFANFLFGWFITAIVVNLPERKLAKWTSVQWTIKKLTGLKHFFMIINFCLIWNTVFPHIVSALE